MIEFDILTMKADTNKLYATFLLRKNVWPNIIKTILDYLPIITPKTLKEWKVAIMSVGQWYKSTEGQYNYKTSIETTYEGQG